MEELKKLMKIMKKRGSGADGWTEVGFEEISDLFNFQKEKEKEIGKVTPELLKRYRQMNKQKEQLEAEIEIMAKQISLEGQKRIDDAFGERQDDLNEMKSALWDEISDYLNHPRERQMSINIGNGVVSAKATSEADFDDDDMDDDRPLQ